MELLSAFCCQVVQQQPPKVSLTLSQNANSGRNVGRVEFQIQIRGGFIEDRDFLYRVVGDINSGSRIPRRLEEIRITNVLVIYRSSSSRSHGMSSYRPRSHGIYQLVYLRLERDGKLSRLGQSPMYNVVETSLFNTYDQRFKVYTCGSCEDFNFSEGISESESPSKSVVMKPSERRVTSDTICQKPRDFRTKDRQSLSHLDTNSTNQSSVDGSSSTTEAHSRLYATLFESISERGDEGENINDADDGGIDYRSSTESDDLNDTLPLHDLSEVEENRFHGDIPLTYPQDKHDMMGSEEDTKDLEQTQRNLKRILEASEYFPRFEFDPYSKPIITEDDDPDDFASHGLNSVSGENYRGDQICSPKQGESLDEVAQRVEKDDLSAIPRVGSSEEANRINLVTAKYSKEETEFDARDEVSSELQFGEEGGPSGLTSGASGDVGHRKTPIENVITSNTGMKTLSHLSAFRCPSRLFTVDEVTSIACTSLNDDLDSVSNQLQNGGNSGVGSLKWLAERDRRKFDQ